MERVLTRGKWERSKTTRIYIIVGISTLVQTHLSHRQLSQLCVVAALWF